MLFTKLAPAMRNAGGGALRHTSKKQKAGHPAARRMFHFPEKYAAQVHARDGSELHRAAPYEPVCEGGAPLHALSESLCPCWASKCLSPALPFQWKTYLLGPGDGRRASRSRSGKSCYFAHICDGQRPYCPAGVSWGCSGGAAAYIECRSVVPEVESSALQRSRSHFIVQRLASRLMHRLRV